MKKKILFFIFDLRGGGAEKVLVNLLQHLNYTKYDVTLMSLFGIGPNKKEIPEQVKYRYVFNKNLRGLNTFMKLFSPNFLHKLLIKDLYDLEIAYLETSPTRIISGCNNKSTKKIAWVHIEIDYLKQFIVAYRNKKEALISYSKFDKIAFVANSAKKSFEQHFPSIKTPKEVILNVNDFDLIRKKSTENICLNLDKSKLNICSVGRLCGQKGYNRLIQVISKLKSDELEKRFHLYIIGDGVEYQSLNKDILNYGLTETISLLGYKNNPYKYISKMDLFVCSSIKEGYSTAVTEAIALDVPVITTKTSGMDEILKNGRYGLITENNIDSLYLGMKKLLLNPSLIKEYKKRIQIETNFNTMEYVKIYEELFDNI